MRQQKRIRDTTNFVRGKTPPWVSWKGGDYRRKVIATERKKVLLAIWNGEDEQPKLPEGHRVGVPHPWRGRKKKGRKKSSGEGKKGGVITFL